MRKKLKYKRLTLQNAGEITSLPVFDQRGSFTRIFCQNDLYDLNKNKNIQQINISFSKKAGTIRGLHYQKPPKAEEKIVVCISGKVFDVIVDIRRESDTYKKFYTVILDSTKMNMVYIPKGFAHGFQTLVDKCKILYLHTEFHSTKHEHGFHYESPSLSIPWPKKITNLSKRDERLRCFDPENDGIIL